MYKGTIVKELYVLSFVLSFVAATMNACTNSSKGLNEEFTDEYANQISALREAYSEHSEDIDTATSIEDIEKSELRYRLKTREALVKMEYVVENLEECSDV